MPRYPHLTSLQSLRERLHRSFVLVHEWILGRKLVEVEFWVWAFTWEVTQGTHSLPVVVMVGEGQQILWLPERDACPFHVATGDSPNYLHQHQHQPGVTEDDSARHFSQPYGKQGMI